MQEIPTPPSHANSDTNPALFVSNAQDINHEGKSVVSQAEGATSTSILPHHVFQVTVNNQPFNKQDAVGEVRPII